jgi:hypothetical protein
MRYVCNQISTRLIHEYNPDDIADVFYDLFWRNKAEDGYTKPIDFWEIPLWITEVSYLIPGRVELNIIDEIGKVSFGGYDPDKVHLFSVLDCTKKYVLEIVKTNPDCTFLLGGYCNHDELDKYSNVIWFNSMRDLAKFIGVEYKYGTDYSLFTGLSCVPRLTLSTGCHNRCKFCTVSRTVQAVSYREALAQVYSFQPLDFKLVYVNDKTYGQCENYVWLADLYNKIKEYNPYFEGFIIQTTCRWINRFDHNDIDLHDYHIKYVELGIETFNDPILHELRKPQTESEIRDAVGILCWNRINCIGNIIIGLPGENEKTYQKTLDFVISGFDAFYSLNIYNLALYDDSELGKEIKHTEDDLDELNKELPACAPFYTQFITDEFYTNIFRAGIAVIS